MKAPLTDPTKGPYYKTLSTAPLNQVGFYNQIPRKDPTKVWQTPLNFDDPSIYNAIPFYSMVVGLDAENWHDDAVIIAKNLEHE